MEIICQHLVTYLFIYLFTQFNYSFENITKLYNKDGYTELIIPYKDKLPKKNKKCGEKMRDEQRNELLAREVE